MPDHSSSPHSSSPQARFTAVTLGVADVGRSAAFYARLGFTRKLKATGDVDADFGTGETWNSGDALNEFMEKFHTGLKTMHMNGNYVIDDAGPGKAKGRTYVRARLFKPDGALLMRFAGWYNDEFAKIDGKWRITKRQVHTIEFEQGPQA